MRASKYTLCGFILLFGVIACGGDDGDSNTSTLSSNDEDTAAEETVTMSNIKVAPDYDFTTTKQLDVAVDLRSITNQRAFVSFYQHWSGTDSAPTPNPDSQLLMQATDSGVITHTLTLGKQQNELLMMVLFSDPQQQAITKVFTVDTVNGFQYPE